MKQLSIFGLALLMLVIIMSVIDKGSYHDLQFAPPADQPTNTEAFAKAFENRQSDLQLKGSGIISQLLADDNQGSRHQRFIVTLANGQTVLIAHNIDLAPRIADLNQGDHVSFFGEYEWNDRGGVVHWTHHDPAGKHPGGWIDHNGKRYQ